MWLCGYVAVVHSHAALRVWLSRTTVWEVPLAKRPTIVHAMVSYVLERHLHVAQGSVQWPAKDIEGDLEPGETGALAAGSGWQRHLAAACVT